LEGGVRIVVTKNYVMKKIVKVVLKNHLRRTKNLNIGVIKIQILNQDKCLKIAVKNIGLIVIKKNAHLLRTFAPMTERALFYTTQYDSTGWEAVKLDMNNFMPLREYFKEFQAALGLNIKQINSALGHRKAEHAFYWNSTQWDLPTEETYQELVSLNLHGFQPKEYEALRQEYEALRRPFNADKKTWDVIEFPIIGGDENTEHPTTKPLGLYRRILSVITEPNQVVLDCCMGSGTAGVVAVELGRSFLGCEIDPKYFSIAQARIKKAAQSPSFDTLPNTASTRQGQVAPQFDVFE
jgi:DNA modification methylase